MNIDFNSVLNTIAAKAKALALNVTEIELKVLEATNEEPWGPHGKDMQEIARAAEDPEKYNLIMNVISERLQMRDENWRLCYKALLLLEHMVKHGPWRVVDELNRSVSSLERLRDDFEYKDVQGRDHGVNVRQRAGELASLVCNMDRVRQEREKAARNANKYKGVGSNDMRGGFGGFGSSSYGSGGGGYGYGGFGSGFGSGGSGSRSAGFGSGSTESVHVPSSQSNFGNSFPNYSGGFGSGSAATTGTSGRREEGFRAVGSGVGEEAEDPFEATRKRIERLKAEGTLQDSTSSGPPPGLAEPASSNAKVPKKLSDVKINPAVAATFATISIPSSGSSGNLAKLAPPPPPGASVKAPSGNDTLDLLGTSDSQPAAKLQQNGTAASGLDWDSAFGLAQPSGGSSSAVPAPAVVAAASADPFADFAVAAAPTPAAAAAPSAGFDSLLSGRVSSSCANASTSGGSASAAAKPTVRPPLSFDDFAELGGPSPAAASLSVGSSISAAPSAPPAADPFAALASTSSFSGAAPPVTASRPAAAAAADPFASFPAPRVASAPPKPAAAPLPFDAFGGAPQLLARTPQPAAAVPTAAADPFAALASSSAPAPVRMAAAARPAPPAVAAAAAPFDPFSSAPAPRPAVTASPTFEAFGSVVPVPPVAAAASSFDDFFGAPSSSGQNALTGARTSAAVGAAAAADPFAVSAFPAFPPPPPPAGKAPPGAAVAMNKTGAALGASTNKSHDPFSGLGF